MKRSLLALVAVLVAFSATAVQKSDLELRAKKLLAKFESMQEKSDKRVPPEILKKAQGIILLDRTKAGFVFAYQGGTGMAIVKDEKSGQWGPIAFMSATEASLGFQIGGQKSFLVFVLMNNKGTSMLTNPTFEFGGEARGTAGDSSAGAEGTVTSNDRPVLVYDERSGLFGGAALKGGALNPDDEANLAYYGEPYSLKEILFEKKVKPSEIATTLAKKINDYSKVEK
jgi:SH3 domain-containing YSC84-like protein 1